MRAKKGACRHFKKDLGDAPVAGIHFAQVQQWSLNLAETQ